MILGLSADEGGCYLADERGQHEVCMPTKAEQPPGWNGLIESRSWQEPESGQRHWRCSTCIVQPPCHLDAWRQGREEVMRSWQEPEFDAAAGGQATLCCSQGYTKRPSTDPRAEAPRNGANKTGTEQLASTASLHRWLRSKTIYACGPYLRHQCCYGEDSLNGTPDHHTHKISSLMLKRLWQSWEGQACAEPGVSMNRARRCLGRQQLQGAPASKPQFSNSEIGSSKTAGDHLCKGVGGCERCADAHSWCRVLLWCLRCLQHRILAVRWSSQLTQECNWQQQPTAPNQNLDSRNSTRSVWHRTGVLPVIIPRLKRRTRTPSPKVNSHRTISTQPSGEVLKIDA